MLRITLFLTTFKDKELIRYLKKILCAVLIDPEGTT